ncbi:diguanylate cyclase domain-containing protein [Deinococcus sonorensis]|uniref:Diguanylate cyclase n=2 Tax=Deinococcus sonorensis TaxID=309891 RepID=A0AAU7UA94_9DEIO
MLNWLTLAWNLALLISVSFFISLGFLSWPLTFNRLARLYHSVLIGLSMLLLSVGTERLGGTPGLAAHVTDLRYVPLTLLTLVHGPGWGLLACLPLLLVQPAFSVNADSVYSLAITVLTATLLRPQFNLFRPVLWRDWWRVTLLFAGLALPVLWRGGEPAALFPAVLVVASNILGFLAGVLVFRSRFRLLAVTERLRRQAYTDALTGIANRRQFESDLAALAPGGVLCIVDLDHFKRINDSFGHDVGDEYLQRVAASLSRVAGRSSRAYRLGGEEFALIVPATEAAEATRLAQEVLAQVQQLSHHANPDGILTCSVGMARRHSDEPAQATYRRADLALFSAKAAGRNRVEDSGDTDQLPSSPLDAASGSREGHGPLLWETVQKSLSLAALERPPSDSDWLRLLQAAILSVPDVQCGSINIREGQRFRQCAQIGFDPALVGLSHTAQEQLDWYGLGEAAWRRGQPRVLHGEEIRRKSTRLLDQYPPTTMQFMEHGHMLDIEATLCIPVVIDGEVIAHLNLDSLQPGTRFSTEDISVARAFADQVTLMLISVYRREALAERTREQAVYADLSLSVLNARSRSDIVQPLLEALKQLYGTPAQLIVQVQGELHLWQSVPGTPSAEVSTELFSLLQRAIETRSLAEQPAPQGQHVALPLRWASGSLGVVLLTLPERSTDPAPERQFLQQVALMVSSGLQRLDEWERGRLSTA